MHRDGFEDPDAGQLNDASIADMADQIGFGRDAVIDRLRHEDL
jgi:hypothetical protein